MPAEKFAEEEGMLPSRRRFSCNGHRRLSGGPERDESVPISTSCCAPIQDRPRRAVAAEPTAQVIHDCYYGDGRPVTMAPRYVLRRVLELYEGARLGTGGGAGARFFLVEPNIDSDYPLKPPVGRSGRPKPVARPTVLPPSTSSIRCSMTCIRSVMRRISRSIP